MAASADQTFHVRGGQAGQTLAAVVRKLGGERSWAEARQLIAGRHVQVNGNLCLDEGRRLKEGEVVKLFAHARAAVPTERDVKVRYVDRDLIVVEKPAGMTTLRHAEERNWDERRRQRQPTLDETLQRMLPTILPREQTGSATKLPPHLAKKFHKPKPRGPKSPPPKLPRVRPVHRLDRDTSGLMLFALTPQAEQTLIHAFKKHVIRRSYFAVAVGRVEAGTIESWIVRDRGDGLRGSSPLGKAAPDAQDAVTHVKPVEHIGDSYTVIECRLETGRTHQIRIHLSEQGHMLCGEKVYTRPAAGAAAREDPSGAPRHALHSAGLEFVHPTTGKTLKFTSPLPRDLGEWLGKLKKTVVRQNETK